MLEGLDEEGCVEEPGHHSEKKRRLSVDQVKALEKNFEVENKLEPDRKVKLAQELGLQPRQVAVWFQNRRARWKTKQLERDYGVLKANYEALKLNHDSLQRDNEALLNEVTKLIKLTRFMNPFDESVLRNLNFGLWLQIKELKSRVQEENNNNNTESDASVKEEMITLQDMTPLSETAIPGSDSKELSYDCCFKSSDDGVDGTTTASLFAENLKDGSSDSDSSAILNEDNNSPNAAISSSGVLQSHDFFMSPGSSSLKFNCSSSSSPSSMSCFQFQKQYHPAQYVKMEEHNFLSADEACNFFSDEQPPTLQWYCQEEWN